MLIRKTLKETKKYIAHGPKVYECNDCGKCYHSNSALSYHQRQKKHFTDTGTVVCGNCNEIYTHRGLKLHQKHCK